MRAKITAFNGLAQVIVRSKAGESGAAKVEIATVDHGRASVDLVTK
jgi:hypothetical protein